MENINFEEFQKIDLRVAKIINAEKIEGSEKLLKLEVDLGGERRQIVAGIGKFYNPEDLISKEIVVVANLEPKHLMGIESQGMLLAADSNGEPIILVPQKDALPGSKIK
jgi:methionine--tRNA ligase beta chain